MNHFLFFYQVQDKIGSKVSSMTIIAGGNRVGVDDGQLKMEMEMESHGSVSIMMRLSSALKQRANHRGIDP